MGRGQEVWCHECGCRMVQRHGKYGDFWGCLGFPLCKATLRDRDASLRMIEDDADQHDRDEEDRGIGLVGDYD